MVMKIALTNSTTYGPQNPIEDMIYNIRIRIEKIATYISTHW